VINAVIPRKSIGFVQKMIIVFDGRNPALRGVKRGK